MAHEHPEQYPRAASLRADPETLRPLREITGGRGGEAPAPSSGAARRRYRVLNDHGYALPGVYRNPLPAQVWAAFLTRCTGRVYVAAREGIDSYIYLHHDMKGGLVIGDDCLREEARRGRQG